MRLPAIKSAPMLHTHPSFFRRKSHPAGQITLLSVQVKTQPSDHQRPSQSTMMTSCSLLMHQPCHPRMNCLNFFFNTHSGLEFHYASNAVRPQLKSRQYDALRAVLQLTDQNHLDLDNVKMACRYVILAHGAMAVTMRYFSIFAGGSSIRFPRSARPGFCCHL